MANPKPPEPMAGAIHEAGQGFAEPLEPRQCYAVEQMVDEVRSLFPDIPADHSNFDVFNASLDVLFDTSVLSEEDRAVLEAIFTNYALDQDPRIDAIIVGPEGILVSMYPSARTKDNRDPFGVDEAFTILSVGEPL